MIIESLKKYFEGCPLLAGGRVNVNFLAEKPLRYSIDTVAANPVVKSYCDGGTLRQYRFVFALRSIYDEETSENIQAAAFFEKLADWVEEQNEKKNFPALSGRATAISVETVSTGCLSDSSTGSARLQMELRLLYRQEK